MVDRKKPWTGQEFSAFSVALLGTEHGRQSAIARELNVDSRGVRRWAKGGPLGGIRDELLKVAGVEDGGEPTSLRHGWVAGQGLESGSGASHVHIIHARFPPFIARTVPINESTDLPEQDEGSADILVGLVRRAEPDWILYEFQGIDRSSASVELTTLLEVACDAACN